MTGNANTALGMNPDGRVWALNEQGLPFRVKVEKDGKVKAFQDTLNAIL
jgi:hypothetical protein